MPTADEIRASVEAYIAAVNANDKDTFLDRFAPDAVWHDPVGAPPHVGREGIGAFWDQTRTMARRFEMIIDDLVVCGAEPLFMTDYIATGKVVPARIAAIVAGIAGLALLLFARRGKA